VTDDPETSAPEALIEEARQRQRQRTRRRRTILVAAAFLAVVGFGIAQLARGGSGVHATPPATSAAQAPTVLYLKQVVLKIVPGLPVEKWTVEQWSAMSAPGAFRQVVTFAGGKRIEVGAAPGQDKVLGPKQISYLYEPSTDTIYRTGWNLPPTPSPPTPFALYKAVLAQPGTHLAGTRTYRGRSVYVIKQRTADADGTAYVDTTTYRLMRNDVRGTALHTSVRTLVFKVLAPTKANAALASLSAAHPRAHIVRNAPPRIRELFARAAFPFQ
jgi:hypothetical protein